MTTTVPAATTVMMTTTDVIVDESRLASKPARVRPSWRHAVMGVRVRILAWFVVLLVIATFVSLFLFRQLLSNRLDERIDAELTQAVGTGRR